MKTNNFKKLLVLFMTTTLVMPAAVSFAEEEIQSDVYEVIYDLNYDKITSTWDYAEGGVEGSRAIESNDGFSGKSIKMTTNTGGYAAFMPRRGWDGKDFKIALDEGETYIMSFKVKKINPTATVNFEGIRDKNGKWVYGLGEAFRPTDIGWRTVSYQFKAGETTGSGAVFLEEVPIFMYKGVNSEDIVLIDDFRAVQINDMSILDGTDPTAEVTELSPQKMTVKFSQDMMSADVSNSKAYIIDGAEAQSVTYNSETRTAEVTPSTDLMPGTSVSVAISACDYLGRAIYTTTECSVAYPPETVCITSIDEEAEEIDSIDSITLSFTNPINELTDENCVLTAESGDDTSTVVEKLDSKTYRIDFSSFLKAGRYTLNISGITDAYGREVDEKNVNFAVKKVVPYLVLATPSDCTGEIPAGSMNVSLKFNKSIDEETTEGISVDNGAEIADVEVLDNVVAFTLTRLEASKTYTVTISGLCDTDGEMVSKTTLTYYTEQEMPMIYKNSFENASASGNTLSDTDYRRLSVNGAKTLDTNEYITAPSALKVVLYDKNNADLVMGTGANQNYDVKIKIGKRYRMSFCVKIPDDSDLKSFVMVNGDNKTYLGGRQNAVTTTTEIDGKDGWYNYVIDFTGESQNNADIASGTVHVPSLRFETKAAAADNYLFYMDDLELYQYPDTYVVNSSVESNAESLAVDEPIRIVFNGTITDAAATIGNIECATEINGNVLTVTPQRNPEYGRYYELEINITDKNGIESNHKIPFKTETAVKVFNVTVDGADYTEGMTVDKDSDISINVNATVSMAKDVYALIVVYGEDGYSTEMKCEKLDFAAGEQSVSLAVDKSMLAAGKNMKLYLWNSLNKMEIIRDAMTFSLQ